MHSNRNKKRREKVFVVVAAAAVVVACCVDICFAYKRRASYPTYGSIHQVNEKKHIKYSNTFANAQMNLMRFNRMRSMKRKKERKEKYRRDTSSSSLLIESIVVVVVVIIIKNYFNSCLVL